MREEFCEGCGQIHEQPYSKDLLELYHEIQKAESPEERSALMTAFAEQFADDLDETDEFMEEPAHELVAEFQLARLQYYSLAHKLARCVIRGMHNYDAEEKARLQKTKKGHMIN